MTHLEWEINVAPGVSRIVRRCLFGPQHRMSAGRIEDALNRCRLRRAPIAIACSALGGVEQEDAHSAGGTRQRDHAFLTGEGERGTMGLTLIERAERSVHVDSPEVARYDPSPARRWQ